MAHDSAAPSGRPLTARQVRDLAAVVLIVAGLVGMVVVASLWEPLLGGLAASLCLLGAGIFLGWDR